MVGWGGLEVREALLLGAILAVVLAGAGWGTRALTAGGAVTAWLIGTIVLGLGGPACAGVIIVFFIGSSVVSNAGAEIKARPSTMFAKGTRRDAWQVAANGGLPTLLAAAYGGDRVLSGGAEGTASLALFAAFVGAVAAVTADTWATEIGLLSAAPPVKITSGEVVERGTSGAVTVLGTVAATAGATLIGLTAMVMYAFRDALAFGIFDLAMLDFGVSALRLLPIGAVAGLASAAFDSFLGATVQGVYWNDRLERETERRRGPEGRRHKLIRGNRWITNDVINALASTVGAALAWTLWMAW